MIWPAIAPQTATLAGPTAKGPSTTTEVFTHLLVHCTARLPAALAPVVLWETSTKMKTPRFPLQL